jgi:hypothetical protein
MGVFAAIYPSALALFYGIPVPSTSDARSGTIGHAYVSALGARDVALGGVALALTLNRDSRSVGYMMIAGVIVTVADGLIAIRYSENPSMHLPIHWGGAAGASLLAFLSLRTGRSSFGKRL